jgi:hypothetical protein
MPFTPGLAMSTSVLPRTAPRCQYTTCFPR